MPVGSSFQVHAIQASIRFIQGYRYLDRCGEALVKLENLLESGWIPAETLPMSGSLKNDQLGMTAVFNSDAMSLSQSHFISFEHFLDQACKVFDTLWQTFDIERINLPSLRVVFQKGFGADQLDEASRYLLDLGLCNPHVELTKLMGASASALDFVLVTQADQEWQGGLVHRRRRVESKVVRQESQPPFDDRLLKRVRQLRERQREAMAALMELRKERWEVAPVAAQIDAEDSFETELNAQGFDLPAFLNEGWTWAESVRNGIADLKKRGA